ncbi:MAG: S1-like domain-containing RNA-binding protein [Acholeplasmataceae bacterium]|jgi:predicted RNA-binding protein (virulence factor B family)
MLKPGEIQPLKVLRKTDIGYMLVTQNKDEVFLHNNETNFKDLEINSSVNAFLYYDNKGRLAATLFKPIITKDQQGWLRVSGINQNLGVFLDNGINKDILYSKDHLPNNIKLWPKVDDYLYIKLEVLKNFMAINGNHRKMENFNQGDKIKARVIKISEDGITLLTKNLTSIFVKTTNLRRIYRIGEETDVIINYRHNEYYSGQLTLQKEKQMLNDAEIILKYLESSGKMKLNDKSSPDEIQQVFNMSKKAFKRALGTLYKNRKIDFINDETILKR